MLRYKSLSWAGQPRNTAAPAKITGINRIADSVMPMRCITTSFRRAARRHCAAYPSQPDQGKAAQRPAAQAHGDGHEGRWSQVACRAMAGGRRPCQILPALLGPSERALNWAALEGKADIVRLRQRLP